MKIISWNVADFRACLKKGFDDFFKEIDADVFCIQESKVLPEQFEYQPEGYYQYLNPAEKKGYSGTLVYTRVKPLNVTFGMGIDEHDHEGRIITLEFEKFFLVTEYVPNVKRELTRLDYRMVWEDDFRRYLKELEKTKTRGLTTFYFNDRNNKDFQEYEGKQYNLEYEFGGKVVEQRQEKTVIEIKNKLQVGDELEIIVPNQIETVKFTIDELWDIDTEEKITHVNPGKAEQKVIMKLPIKVEKDWILRRKK